MAICLAAICYLLSSNENRINFRSWRFYARHFFRLHVIGIVASMAFLTYITIFDTNSIRFILGSLIGIPSGLILIKSIKNIFKKGE